MSWCGGGEISPTPGVECRVLATHGYTLCAGSWPPSPGLAPCAILICRSSAWVRYRLVTPNRPDATRLTALRRTGAGSRPHARADPPPPAPAPLAGVAPRAEPVHRHRQRLVRLLADRAVAHRAGGEP